jgi:hypothetical protein
MMIFKKRIRLYQKQEWPVAAMFINGWELNTFQGCFLPNFDSFGQAVTEGKIL